MISTAGIRCENCGAYVDREGARFCNYCGTKLPPAPTGQVAALLPAEALAARFEALLAHDALPELMEHEPALPRPGKSLMRPGISAAIIASSFFVAMILVWAALYDSNRTAALLLAILIVPMTIAIYVFARRALPNELPAEEDHPTRKHPVLIADERTKLTANGNFSRTEYFVTAQSRDGDRAEYRVNEALAAYVAKGDMGVAYIHRGHLIAFRRVEV